MFLNLNITLADSLQSVKLCPLRPLAGTTRVSALVALIERTGKHFGARWAVEFRVLILCTSLVGIFFAIAFTIVVLIWKLQYSAVLDGPSFTRWSIDWG